MDGAALARDGAEGTTTDPEAMSSNGPSMTAVMLIPAAAGSGIPDASIPRIWVCSCMIGPERTSRIAVVVAKSRGPAARSKIAVSSRGAPGGWRVIACTPVLPCDAPPDTGGRNSTTAVNSEPRSVGSSALTGGGGARIEPAGGPGA